MQISLHKNARTTPATRREIRNSSLPIKVLARRLGLSPATVRKWKARPSVEDASHRPHTLHTTLTPDQEQVVVAVRTTLLLSLDDLLVVTREFINPQVSRGGLHRCLQRYGVSGRSTIAPEQEGVKKPHQAFKDYAPGFVHIDVKYLPKMPDEDSRRYLFVAIDRATRWVYLELLPNKTAALAAGFLERLLKAAPFKIEKLLTDNGKEFTDRFCTSGERSPGGKHRFDQVCAKAGIEHRLTKPRHPQTNGMVERFNGRISEVLATNRFDSAWSLEQALTNYASIYNHHIPQKALGYRSPVQAMRNWQESHPELFNIEVYNQAGLDSYPQQA
jgi:transposase InsO family protein